MANTIVFSFDFANPIHAQIFAQVCALTAPAGVPMQMLGTSVGVSDVPAQASTPTPAPTRTYAPAQDVQCKWVVDGMYVSYTLEDGKYVGQTGARKTLNARIRDAKGEYDATRKAYKFASKKAAEKFAAEVSALVTASEIEAVRAKAQARAERKVQRA